MKQKDLHDTNNKMTRDFGVEKRVGRKSDLQHKIEDMIDGDDE